VSQVPPSSSAITLITAWVGAPAISACTAAASCGNSRLNTGPSPTVVAALSSFIAAVCVMTLSCVALGSLRFRNGGVRANVGAAGAVAGAIRGATGRRHRS
jgi:hypothetical protein